MLLRYHSRYSSFVRDLLQIHNIDDYVFSSDVSFFEPGDNGKGHKIIKNKAWPEAHEIIIKAVNDETSDKIYDAIVEYKEKNNIGNKIKILLVPLVKNG